MAKDNSNNSHNNSSLLGEPGSNKSFVKKVRSRVSGLLPSSLSKWFGNDDNNKATVRQREDDDDDDEYCEIQPPSKKAKMPSPANLYNNYHMNSFSPPNFNVNNTNRLYTTITSNKQNSSRSTLSEPVAGPSGMKLRSLFAPSGSTHTSSENLLNGDKDSDSGDESTSGYSSMPRLSSKNVENSEVTKKVETSTPDINPNSLFNSSTFGGRSRSLFTERSLSPQINSSLSSRRPSFNASTFGSPNFIDRTLSTKRIINSPFYSGRTTYGGASAYSFQQANNPRTSIKRQVEVKPVNQSVSSDKSTLSKTARRILDTLEQYGTPVSDAKKIPNPSFKKSQHEGLLSKYTGANPYLMREHKASNKELQLPTVPDLLKMKLKERLQDSTVAVRQIATTSKLALNSDEYKIRTVEEETPKHTNKIKNKVMSIRQKPENDTVEEVKLPDVALPITTLPKFDFSLPPPSSCSKPLVTVACRDSSKKETSSAVSDETVQNEVLPLDQDSIKSNSEAVEYTFSDPLVIADNLISITAINDFKFSDPVCKQKGKATTEVVSSNSKLSTSSVFNLKSSNISNSPDITSNFKLPDSSGIKLKRKDNSAELKPAAQLLSGSVEEILGKKTETESSSLLDKFKPAAGTWECSVCLLRNLPGKLKCAACEASKDKIETPKKSLGSVVGFGEEFKMNSDKWECSTCMVRNASTDEKCVACTAPKPTSTKPNGPISSFPSPVKTFGDKFKPPSSTWECPTCMIRNKAETEKCLACETSKPGKTQNKSVIGFGDCFKKKSNEWECGTCMVRNPSDKISCMACETPKPGAGLAKSTKPKETNAPIESFGFGFFPGNINSQGFKIEPVQSTKSEASDKSNTVSSIFGNASTTDIAVTTSVFANASTTASTVATTEASSVPIFKFGIPPKQATETTTAKSNEQKTESLITSTEKLPEKPTAAPTGFIFNSDSSNTSKSAPPADKFQLVNTTSSKAEEKPTQSIIPVGFNPTNNLLQPVKQPSSTTIQASDSSSQKQTENLVQKPVSSATGFIFNANVSPSLKRSANSTDLPGSGIGVKKDAPSPAAPLLFSLPKQQLLPNKADSNLLNKPSLPINGNSTKTGKNIFGSLTSTAPTQTIPNNLFTFSPSQTQTVLPATTTNTNLFNFGAKATTAFGTATTTTAVPAFGTATTATTVPAFGTAATTTAVPAFGTVTTTTAAPIFGTTATTAETPVFKFGVSSTDQQPNSQAGFNITTNVQPIANNMFGSNSNTSIFGAPSKPVFEAPSKPSFETSTKPVFEAPNKSVFEAAPNKSVFEAAPNKSVFEAAPAVAPPFGSAAPTGFGASSSTSEVKPFSFGARASENPPPSKMSAFTFGQNSKPAEPDKTPAFSFGTSAPSNAPVGGFSFNPSTNAAANPTFNFNAPKVDNPSPFQSATPAPSMFGTPAQVQPPAQPVQNGGFNFGTPASNNNVKTGFNFGVAPTPQFNPAPLATSGVFNFGPPNPNPALPAAGAFNFGAAPPAFNANIKPTFNFTGGTTPTFSAQPSGENSMVAQRKKIRAVRRTQR